MDIIRAVAACLVPIVFVATASAPTWTYATYLGGSGVDDCDGITTDSKGSVYLACHSNSNDFLGTRRQATRDDFDAFVVKLDAQTHAVAYATRIGGSSYDGAFKIKVDEEGNAYAVGFTKSADFPITSDAAQSRYGGGESDAFLVILTPQGRVRYSTFIGGSDTDQGNALVLTNNGGVYIAGTTWSRDFPGSRVGAAHPGRNADIFLTALVPGLTDATRSITLGGANDEKLTGLAYDGHNRLYATGFTASTDLPTRNAEQSALKGKLDAFLIAFDLKKTTIDFATYFGGSADDSAWSIAVGRDGMPVIAGTSASQDLPTTTSALQPRIAGAEDAFVAKFKPSGDLVWATYFGGSRNDSAGYDGDSITTDARGNIWLAGMTASPDVPVRGGVQSSFGGGELDGFIAGFSHDGKRLCLATYAGGSDRDLLEGIALTRGGLLYATGLAASRNIPISTGGRSYSGGRFDAMLVALVPDHSCH